MGIAKISAIGIFNLDIIAEWADTEGQRQPLLK